MRTAQLESQGGHRVNLWKCRAMETKQRFPPHLEIANDAIPTFPQVLPRLSYERTNKTATGSPLQGSPGSTCPNQARQVITTLFLVLFSLAGFGVTTIGRF